MKRYRVGLTQVVYEGTDIEVDADTEEAAELLALEQAQATDFVKWRFIGAEAAEIVSVDIVPSPRPRTKEAGDAS